MKLLTQAKIDALNALTSNNLSVQASPTRIVMQLQAVVAMTNFKALAGAGRVGHGASFDSRTKALTIALLAPSACKRRQIRMGTNATADLVDAYETPDRLLIQTSDENWAATVAIYPFDNFAAIEKLAERLAGTKAKTFPSTRAATAARNAPRSTSSMRRASQDMDMPMFDPATREWYDQEIESRAGGIARQVEQRPNMGSYGQND